MNAFKYVCSELLVNNKQFSRGWMYVGGWKRRGVVMETEWIYNRHLAWNFDTPLLPFSFSFFFVRESSLSGASCCNNLPCPFLLISRTRTPRLQKATRKTCCNNTMPPVVVALVHHLLVPLRIPFQRVVDQELEEMIIAWFEPLALKDDVTLNQSTVSKQRDLHALVSVVCYLLWRMLRMKQSNLICILKSTTTIIRSYAWFDWTLAALLCQKRSQSKQVSYFFGGQIKSCYMQKRIDANNSMHIEWASLVSRTATTRPPLLAVSLKKKTMMTCCLNHPHHLVLVGLIWM